MCVYSSIILTSSSVLPGQSFSPRKGAGRGWLERATKTLGTLRAVAKGLAEGG